MAHRGEPGMPRGRQHAAGMGAGGSQKTPTHDGMNPSPSMMRPTSSSDAYMQLFESRIPLFPLLVEIGHIISMYPSVILNLMYIILILQNVSFALNPHHNWGTIMTRMLEALSFTQLPTFEKFMFCGYTATLTIMCVLFAMYIVVLVACAIRIMSFKDYRVTVASAVGFKLMVGHSLAYFWSGILFVPAVQNFIALVMCVPHTTATRAAGTLLWYPSLQCSEPITHFALALCIVGVVLLTAFAFCLYGLMAPIDPYSASSTARMDTTLSSLHVPYMLLNSVLFQYFLAVDGLLYFAVWIAITSLFLACAYMYFLPYYNSANNRMFVTAYSLTSFYAVLAAITHAPAVAAYFKSDKNVDVALVIGLFPFLAVGSNYVALLPRVSPTFRTAFSCLQKGIPAQPVVHFPLNLPRNVEHLPLYAAILREMHNSPSDAAAAAAAAAASTRDDVSPSRGGSSPSAGGHSFQVGTGTSNDGVAEWRPWLEEVALEPVGPQLGRTVDNSAVPPEILELRRYVSRFAVPYVDSIIFPTDVEVATRFLVEYVRYTDFPLTAYQLQYAALIYIKGCALFVSSARVHLSFAAFLYYHAKRPQLAYDQLEAATVRGPFFTDALRIWQLRDQLSAELNIGGRSEALVRACMLHREVLRHATEFWNAFMFDDVDRRAIAELNQHGALSRTYASTQFNRLLNRNGCDLDLLACYTLFCDTVLSANDKTADLQQALRDTVRAYRASTEEGDGMPSDAPHPQLDDWLASVGSLESYSKASRGSRASSAAARDSASIAAATVTRANKQKSPSSTSYGSSEQGRESGSRLFIKSTHLRQLNPSLWLLSFISVGIFIGLLVLMLKVRDSLKKSINGMYTAGKLRAIAVRAEVVARDLNESVGTGDSARIKSLAGKLSALEKDYATQMNSISIGNLALSDRGNLHYAVVGPLWDSLPMRQWSYMNYLWVVLKSLAFSPLTSSHYSAIVSPNFATESALAFNVTYDDQAAHSYQISLVSRSIAFALCVILMLIATGAAVLIIRSIVKINSLRTNAFSLFLLVPRDEVRKLYNNAVRRERMLDAFFSMTTGEKVRWILTRRHSGEKLALARGERDQCDMLQIALYDEDAVSTYGASTAPKANSKETPAEESKDEETGLEQSLRSGAMSSHNGAGGERKQRGRSPVETSTLHTRRQRTATTGSLTSPSFAMSDTTGTRRTARSELPPASYSSTRIAQSSSSTTKHSVRATIHNKSVRNPSQKSRTTTADNSKNKAKSDGSGLTGSKGAGHGTVSLDKIRDERDRNNRESLHDLRYSVSVVLAGSAYILLVLLIVLLAIVCGVVKERPYDEDVYNIDMKREKGMSALGENLMMACVAAQSFSLSGKERDFSYFASLRGNTQSWNVTLFRTTKIMRDGEKIMMLSSLEERYAAIWQWLTVGVRLASTMYASTAVTPWETGGQIFASLRWGTEAEFGLVTEAPRVGIYVPRPNILKGYDIDSKQSASTQLNMSQKMLQWEGLYLAVLNFIHDAELFALTTNYTLGEEIRDVARRESILCICISAVSLVFALGFVGSYIKLHREMLSTIVAVVIVLFVAACLGCSIADLVLIQRDRSTEDFGKAMTLSSYWTRAVFIRRFVPLAYLSSGHLAWMLEYSQIKSSPSLNGLLSAVSSIHGESAVAAYRVDIYLAMHVTDIAMRLLLSVSQDKDSTDILPYMNTTYLMGVTWDISEEPDADMTVARYGSVDGNIFYTHTDEDLALTTEERHALAQSTLLSTRTGYYGERELQLVKMLTTSSATALATRNALWQRQSQLRWTCLACSVIALGIAILFILWIIYEYLRNSALYVTVARKYYSSSTYRKRSARFDPSRAHPMPMPGNGSVHSRTATARPDNATLAPTMVNTMTSSSVLLRAADGAAGNDPTNARVHSATSRPKRSFLKQLTLALPFVGLLIIAGLSAAIIGFSGAVSKTMEDSVTILNAATLRLWLVARTMALVQQVASDPSQFSVVATQLRYEYSRFRIISQRLYFDDRSMYFGVGHDHEQDNLLFSRNAYFKLTVLKGPDIGNYARNATSSSPWLSLDESEMGIADKVPMSNFQRSSAAQGITRNTSSTGSGGLVGGISRALVAFPVETLPSTALRDIPSDAASVYASTEAISGTRFYCDVARAESLGLRISWGVGLNFDSLWPASVRRLLVTGSQSAKATLQEMEGLYDSLIIGLQRSDDLYYRRALKRLENFTNILVGLASAGIGATILVQLFFHSRLVSQLTRSEMAARAMLHLIPKRTRDTNRRIIALIEDRQNRSLEDELEDTIAQIATNAIVVVSATGVVLRFNELAEALFGWSTSDVVGQNISMLIADDADGTAASKVNVFMKRFRRQANAQQRHPRRHPQQQPQPGAPPSSQQHYQQQQQSTASRDQQLEATPLDVPTEFTGRKRDGQTINLEIRCSLIKCSNGERILVCFIEEVPNRYELTLQKRINDTLLEASADPVILIDPFGVMLTVNPATMACFGYEHFELLGQNVKVLMPQKVAMYHDAFLARHRGNTTTAPVNRNVNVQGQRKDGTLFTLKLGVREVEQFGEPSLFVGVLEDPSLQSKLETQTNMTESIIDLSPLPVLAINERGTIVTYSRAAALLFQYSKADVKRSALNMQTLFAEQYTDTELFLRRFIKPADGSTSTPLGRHPKHRKGVYYGSFGAVNTVVGRKRDGTTFTAQMMVREMQQEQSQSMLFLCYLEDITEKLVIEERQNRLYQVLVAYNMPVIVTSDDGTIIHVNRVAEQLLQYRSDEAIGSNVSIIVPDDIATYHDGYIATYQRTRVRRVLGSSRKTKARRKDGKEIAVQLQAHDIPGSATTPQYFFAFLQNTTEEEVETLEHFYTNEAIIAHSYVGIITISNVGTIESFSPAAEECFGYNEADVCGAMLDVFFPNIVFDLVPSSGPNFANSPIGAPSGAMLGNGMHGSFALSSANDSMSAGNSSTASSTAMASSTFEGMSMRDVIGTASGATGGGHGSDTISFLSLLNNTSVITGRHCTERLFDVEVTVKEVIDRVTGARMFFSLYCEDVSQLQAQHNAIAISRETRSRFTIPIIRFDGEGVAIIANSAFEKEFRCIPGVDVPGKPLKAYLNSSVNENMEELLAAFNAELKKNPLGPTQSHRIVRDDWRTVAKREDGTSFRASVRFVAVRAVHTTYDVIFIAFIVKREDERIYEEENAVTDAIINLCTVPLVIVDHRGVIMKFSEQACRTFGYANEKEVVGENASILTPEKVGTYFHRGLTQFLETKQWKIPNGTIPLTAVRKDGSLFQCEGIIRESQLDNQPLFIVALRETTADEIAEERAGFAAEVISRSTVGIVSITRTGTITAFNSAACAIFGYDEDSAASELIGKDVGVLMSAEDAVYHVRHLLNYAKTGIGYTINNTVRRTARHRTGALISVFFYIMEIPSVTGEPRDTCYIAFVSGARAPVVQPGQNRSGHSTPSNRSTSPTSGTAPGEAGMRNFPIIPQLMHAVNVPSAQGRRISTPSLLASGRRMSMATLTSTTSVGRSMPFNASGGMMGGFNLPTAGAGGGAATSTQTTAHVFSQESNRAEEEALLQTVKEVGPMMYVTINENCELLSISPETANTLGVKADDVIGTSFVDVFYHYQEMNAATTDTPLNSLSPLDHLEDSEKKDSSESSYNSHGRRRRSSTGQNSHLAATKAELALAEYVAEVICAPLGQQVTRILPARTTAGKSFFLNMISQEVRNNLLPNEQRIFVIVATDVTAQLQAEWTQATCQTIIRRSHQPIVTIDVRSTILFFNEAAERCFRFTAEEAIGKDVSILMPPKTGRMHSQFISTYLHTGIKNAIDREMEVTAQRKDGEWFSASVYVREIKEDVDGSHFFAASFTDRTPIVDIEDAAVITRAVLSTTGRAMVVTDQNSNITFMSVAACEMLGWSPEEMSGKSMPQLLFSGPVAARFLDFFRTCEAEAADIVIPHDPETAVANANKFIKLKGKKKPQWNHEKADAEAEASASGIMVSGGRRRRSTISTPFASSTVLSSVKVSGAKPTLITTTTPTMSAAAAQAFGVGGAEQGNTNVTTGLTAEVPEERRRLKFSSVGLRRKDGRTILVDVECETTYDLHNRVSGCVCSFVRSTDVTVNLDVSVAEETLNIYPDPMFILNRIGVISRVNKPMMRLFHFKTPDQIVGLSIATLMPEVHLPQVVVDLATRSKNGNLSGSGMELANHSFTEARRSITYARLEGFGESPLPSASRSRASLSGLDSANMSLTNAASASMTPTMMGDAQAHLVVAEGLVLPEGVQQQANETLTRLASVPNRVMHGITHTGRPVTVELTKFDRLNRPPDSREASTHSSPHSLASSSPLSRRLRTKATSFADPVNSSWGDSFVAGSMHSTVAATSQVQVPLSSPAANAAQKQVVDVTASMMQPFVSDECDVMLEGGSLARLRREVYTTPNALAAETTADEDEPDVSKSTMIPCEPPVKLSELRRVRSMEQSEQAFYIGIIEDVDERSRRSTAAALAERLFANSSSALIGIDENGTVMRANRAALELFDFPESGLIKQKATMLLTAQSFVTYSEFMASQDRMKKSKSRTQRTCYLRGEKRTGEVFDIEWTLMDVRLINDVACMVSVRAMEEQLTPTMSAAASPTMASLTTMPGATASSNSKKEK